MSGISHINDILADNVAHYVKDARDCNIYTRELRRIRSNCSPLIMEENGENATLKKIYVIDIPHNSLVLKPDNFNVHLFKANTWNKACDYLILAQDSHGNYALFIELKSSLNDRPDATDSLLIMESNEDKNKSKQIEGACNLFDFLRLIVNKVYHDSELDTFKIYKIVLYNEVKTRSPLQSNQRLISGQRVKSEDIKTLKVNDAQTLRFSELIRIFEN